MRSQLRYQRSPTTVARAFTLIEILLCTAILALLAGILVPGILGAREKARQGACLSHVRQIGAGVAQYSQDFDDTLPFWSASYLTTPPLPESPELSWKAAVQPYIRGGRAGTLAPTADAEENGVWRCPSIDAWYDGLGEEQDWATRPATASYGVSMFIVYRYFGPPPAPPETRYRPGLPLASLRAPTQTVLLGESGWSGRIDTPVERRWRTYETFYHNAHVQNWERREAHQGGANYVFCDGHVIWKKADTIYPADLKEAYRAADRFFAATEEDREGLAQYLFQHTPP